MTNKIESKICLSAFYFGKLNNYFPLWLNCCKHNKTIDFLLFTDDNTEYDYPINVKRVLLTFEEIRHTIKNHFDFEINLEVPYKICDIVPAFGDIFREDFKAYDFWGHIDLDLIFGNIREFVPESILSKYDRISWRGHFSLYKNSSTISNLYKKSLYGVELYKTIFTSPYKALFAFEEQEINNIFENNGFKVYKALKFADLHPAKDNFQMMHFSETYQVNNQQQIFEFNNGRLFRHYLVNGILRTEEMMYVHFLRRAMEIDSNLLSIDRFLILPNHFSNPTDISKESVVKWSKERSKLYYYLERLNFDFFRKRRTTLKDLKDFDDAFHHLNRKSYEVIIDEQIDERDTKS